MAEQIKVEPHKSSIGNLDANLAALLFAYVGAAVLGLIPGVMYAAFVVPIIFYFVEKDSKFVKFHCMQAILLSVVQLVIGFILGIVVSAIVLGGAATGGLGGAAAGIGIASILTVAVSALFLVMYIIVAIKSYKYVQFKLPLVGNWAEKIVAKSSK